MAILGKYRTSLAIHCMACGMVHHLTVRTKDWTGVIRTRLLCPTHECDADYDIFKRYKGLVSSSADIALLTLMDGSQIVLEDYECGEPNAHRFVAAFNSVWRKIPTAARHAIEEHWLTGKGSPHVWLLEDRREWGGGGWAASSRDGQSLYLVSTLIAKIPEEHLATAIAHELGHILFIAIGDPNHTDDEDPVAGPGKPDRVRKQRAEWLVWHLMRAWGFDQPAIEYWMERNTDEGADGIHFRDQPKTDAEYRGESARLRAEIEERFKEEKFPAEYRQYLGN